jgi:hypothetical protein
VKFGHAAWAHGIPGRSGWGLRFTYLRVGGIDGADDVGQPTSDLSSSDAVLGFSWGRRFAPNLSGGLSAKAMRSEVADVSSDIGLGADAGLLYDMPRHLFLGASVMNLGKGYKFLSEKDPLPTTVGLVVGKGWGPARVTLGGRHRVNEKKFEIGAGVEADLGSLQLRDGYHQRDKARLAEQSGLGNGLQGLTTGLGIKIKNVRFDYALDQQLGDTGVSHNMAFVIAWGGPAVPARPGPKAATPAPKEAPPSKSRIDRPSAPPPAPPPAPPVAPAVKPDRSKLPTTFKPAKPASKVPASTRAKPAKKKRLSRPK